MFRVDFVEEGGSKHYVTRNEICEKLNGSLSFDLNILTGETTPEAVTCKKTGKLLGYVVRVA